MLPCKLWTEELKKLGVSQSDVLLLRASNGKQTVAACEEWHANRQVQDRGLLLSRSCRQSLAAEDGDELELIGQFEAESATEVLLETSNVFVAAWSSLGTGFELNSYLKAVLDGSLLFKGDVRHLSLNGEMSELKISDIQGSKAVSSSAPWPGPWLMDSNTTVQVKATSKKTDGGGQGGQGEAAGFARVGGLAAVIEELKEAVQLPLQNPALYRKIGVTPPRGVLLYGPPGTGKTLLAKSLAEELECPCELLAATDLVGTGFGESEERIKNVFQSCRQQASDRGTGALLFIDEVDAVCPKRDDASEVERRMVAAFLTALDGVHSGDSVVVLGATNRPDAIDPALRRAGRLEREIEVGVPNAEEMSVQTHAKISETSTLNRDVYIYNLFITHWQCHGNASVHYTCISHDQNRFPPHSFTVCFLAITVSRRDCRSCAFIYPLCTTTWMTPSSVSLLGDVMDMWEQICDPSVPLQLVPPSALEKTWWIWRVATMPVGKCHLQP